MLTSGQEAIRAIIYQELPDYQQLEPRSGQGYASFKEDPFYQRIIALFGESEAIRQDPITSTLLGFTSVSANYLAWCRWLSQKTNAASASLSFKRLVYQRSNRVGDTPIQKMPRYQGGRKYSSTLEALFGFAENRRVSDMGFDGHYYTQSRLLVARSGGNHRLLACTLWGNESYLRSKLCYWDEYYPDETLFKALLRIDQLFPSLRYDTSTFYFSGLSHKLDREEREALLLAQARQAKEFYGATAEEQLTVRDYAEAYFKPAPAAALSYGTFYNVRGSSQVLPIVDQGAFRVDSNKKRECTFAWLVTHLEALRAIRSKPEPSWTRRCRNALKGREKPTSFESWYADHRGKSPGH